MFESLKPQIEAALVHQQQVIVFTLSVQASQEMKDFITTLSSFSNKLKLRLSPDVPYPNCFGISLEEAVPNIWFAGIPAGHEFTSLILAILWESGHPQKLSPEIQTQIKNIRTPVYFETYVSLSCHNCPDVVQSLIAMAAINKNIHFTMIDGGVYPELVKQNNILTVPITFKDKEVFHHGKTSVEEILLKMNLNIKKEYPIFDSLIIGGGPAGISAALYSVRKGLSVGIVAHKPGGQIQDTLSIENYTGMADTTGPKLAQDMELHLKKYPVERIYYKQVTHIQKNEENLFEVSLDSQEILTTKTIIIATGAKWRELGVKGEQEFKTKGVCFCPHCDGPLFKNKPVAVIGGGNSGVEAAIDLAGICSQVYLLEFGETLKADAILQHKLQSLDNVHILLNAKTNALTGEQSLQSLVYTNRSTMEEHSLDVAGAFIQIGLVPNTQWLNGLLDTNKQGEILVGRKGGTSIPGIFAAGDCTDIPYKQIIIATGEGAKAALGAFEYLMMQT